MEQTEQEVVTGEAVVLDLPCARFPTRMLAHLIDMLVQLPAAGVITGLIAGAAAGHHLDGASAAALGVTGWLLVVVGYPVIFETLSRGKTLGKLALGLRVVGDDGGPERFRQALVRGLAGAIECWVLLGIPALIASLASQRAKRLGDLFAGTFALRERAPARGTLHLPPVASDQPAAGRMPGAASAGAPMTAPPPLDPVTGRWAASLQLSALPEPLAAATASYLSRYWELDPRAREALAWRLASDVAARVSPPPLPGMPPVYYLGLVLAERRNRDLRRYASPAPPA